MPPPRQAAGASGSMRWPKRSASRLLSIAAGCGTTSWRRCFRPRRWRRSHVPARPRRSMRGHAALPPPKLTTGSPIPIRSTPSTFWACARRTIWTGRSMRRCAATWSMIRWPRSCAPFRPGGFPTTPLPNYARLRALCSIRIGSTRRFATSGGPPSKPSQPGSSRPKTGAAPVSRKAIPRSMAASGCRHLPAR